MAGKRIREFLEETLLSARRDGQVATLAHLYAAALAKRPEDAAAARVAERLRREILPATTYSEAQRREARSRLPASFDPATARENLKRFYEERQPCRTLADSLLFWLLEGDFEDRTQPHCRRLCREEGFSTLSLSLSEGAASALGFGSIVDGDDLRPEGALALEGRDRDLEKHLGLLTLAVRGRRHYLLEGQAGVGKTSFLRELLRRAAERWGRAAEPELRDVRFLLVEAHEWVASEEETRRRFESLYDRVHREPKLIPVFDGFERLLDPALYLHEQFLSLFGGLLVGEGRTLILACRTGPAHRFDLLKNLAKHPLGPLSPEATGRAVRRRLEALLSAEGLAFEGDPEVFCRKVVELAIERYPGRGLPAIALHLAESGVHRARNRIFFLEQPPAGRLSFDRDIWDYVAEEQGLNPELLGKDRRRFYGDLRSRLESEVLGQEHATGQICRRLEDQASLPPRETPRGRFLFVGPPGVGKTALARSLARHLGLGEESFFRFNMSEYSTESARTRFMGSDPGYVGFKATSTLYDKVRARPSCIVLLDEIDRAHPSIQDILLSILEGHGNDAEGHPVHFSQAIFILTTNLGQEQVCAAYEKKLAASDGAVARRELGRSFSDSLLRELILSGVVDPRELEMLAFLDRQILAAKEAFRPELGAPEVPEMLETFVRLRQLRRSFEQARQHTALDRAFLDRIDLILPFFPIREPSILRRILDKELLGFGWPDCPLATRHWILEQTLREPETVRPLQRLIKRAYSERRPPGGGDLSATSNGDRHAQ